MDDSVKVVVAELGNQNEQQRNVPGEGVHHGASFWYLVEGFVDSGLIVWLVGADTIAASAIVRVRIGWRAGPLRGFVGGTSSARCPQGS